jgi:two-component system response regulator MprA
MERQMPERRPRISVINDNAEFLDLMSAILDEDAGYEVSLFKGEFVEISELVSSDPDLIIVDLLLGGASGWEIVTLSRSDERLAPVPIIVCSADVTALRDRETDLERIGNVHMLAKPFAIDEITELVERLIGRAVPASG